MNNREFESNAKKVYPEVKILLGLMEEIYIQHYWCEFVFSSLFTLSSRLANIPLVLFQGQPWIYVFLVLLGASPLKKIDFFPYN